MESQGTKISLADLYNYEMSFINKRKLQKYDKISPGQSVEQIATSSPSPPHGAPPLTTEGCVQDLKRRWRPRPHSLSQADHSPQVDQPPFTENVYIYKVKIAMLLE